MFNYLKYIKTVYECSSFSKAADKLCITQPALSIAISKAEEELGAKLFDRKAKPLQVTDAGKMYIEAAEKALRLEKELKEKITDKPVDGDIRVGAAGIAMNYIIPKILSCYSKKYPKVNTIFYEESAFTLKDYLRNDNIDLLLDTQINEPEYESIPLFTNRILYAVSENLLDDSLISRSYSNREILNNDFLSSDKGKIGFNNLSHIPFLSLQPRNELYSRAQTYFSFYKTHPHTVMYFNQQLTAYNFAQKGFGGTFVGDTLVKELPLDGLRFFEMDHEMPVRTVCISYKKNKYITSAMEAFINTAKSIYQR